MALLNLGQPQEGRKVLAEKVTAAVRTAPQITEFREYDMPDIPDEAALAFFAEKGMKKAVNMKKERKRL